MKLWGMRDLKKFNWIKALKNTRIKVVCGSVDKAIECTYFLRDGIRVIHKIANKRTWELPCQQAKPTFDELTRLVLRPASNKSAIECEILKS